MPREPIYPRVLVAAGDFEYWGYLTTVFRKKHGGLVRCVVEDEAGRLFVHKPEHLRLTDNELVELGVKYKLIVA